MVALCLPRLGERELILVFFVRLFDLRWFPLPLSVMEWLRLVIVALPGLFYYRLFSSPINFDHTARTRRLIWDYTARKGVIIVDFSLPCAAI